jgi:hypothetical protein
MGSVPCRELTTECRSCSLKLRSARRKEAGTAHLADGIRAPNTVFELRTSRDPQHSMSRERRLEYPNFGLVTVLSKRDARRIETNMNPTHQRKMPPSPPLEG